MTTGGGAPRAAAIHDLGYARYAGARRPPSTRWRVIARHEVATAWKTWWRYKSALALAVIGTFVFGTMLYFWKAEVPSMLHGGRVALTFMDVLLPLSFVWFDRAAFLVSLTVGATTIAGDVDGGALPFYFARSTRPLDYLAGKLGGYALVVVTIAAAGPVALSLFRLGMSSTHELVQHLVDVPAALAIGGLATLAYTAVPLGFSALIPNRRYALAAWAAYYVVLGSIAASLGHGAHAWLGALDLSTAVEATAAHLLHASVLPGAHVPLGAAIASILAQAAAALALAWWRIARVRAAGVGGGS